MAKDESCPDTSESESVRDPSDFSDETSIDQSAFVPFDVFFQKQYRSVRHRGEHVYESWKRDEKRPPTPRADSMAKFVNDLRKNLLRIDDVESVEAEFCETDVPKEKSRALRFRTFVDMVTNNADQVDCRGGRFLVLKEETKACPVDPKPRSPFGASSSMSSSSELNSAPSDSESSGKRRPVLMTRKSGARKPSLRDW